MACAASFGLSCDQPETSSKLACQLDMQVSSTWSQVNVLGFRLILCNVDWCFKGTICSKALQKKFANTYLALSTEINSLTIQNRLFLSPRMTVRYTRQYVLPASKRHTVFNQFDYINYAMICRNWFLAPKQEVLLKLFFQQASTGMILVSMV